MWLPEMNNVRAVEIKTGSPGAEFNGMPWSNFLYDDNTPYRKCECIQSRDNKLYAERR
jgi:hypothetical protein